MKIYKMISLIAIACIIINLASCSSSGSIGKTSEGSQVSRESSSTSESSSSATVTTVSSTTSTSTTPTSNSSTAATLKKIAFEQSVFTAPTQVSTVPDMDYQGVKAIYYNSVDYEGKPTKVFAYIGYPASASATNKVPAVVLVHGGGGTAYPQWVQQWAQRGYAAIAIDTEGHIPTAGAATTFVSHPNAGPTRTGDFNDVTKPLQNQWMYQACAAVFKANSLLRKDVNINASKIGICGISWGGIITSIVISQDARFAFGIPIYGCGFMNNSEGYFSDVFKYNSTAESLWEPSNWLSQTKMPVLWINDANDKYFSIRSTAKSSTAVLDSSMTVLPLLMHGHDYGWGVQESYAFADKVCKGKAGLIKVIKQPSVKDSTVTFSVPKGITAASAQLIYSKVGYSFDVNNNCLANWIIAATPISGGTVNAKLPAGTKTYYINIIDNRGLASSTHLVIQN